MAMDRGKKIYSVFGGLCLWILGVSFYAARLRLITPGTG